MAQIACNLGAEGMGGAILAFVAFQPPRIASRPRLRATGATRDNLEDAIIRNKLSGAGIKYFVTDTDVLH